MWVCAPGVALVVVEVDVDVLVDVDVDVFVDVVLLVPQPMSARISAAVMVAAVKCFINQLSRKLGRYQRQPCGLRLVELGQESCWLVSTVIGNVVPGSPSLSNSVPDHSREHMVMQ